jgi:hypothetical protein
VKFRWATWLVILLLWVTPAPGQDARQADVVVYGGTAGGVVAAVAAARARRSVVLVEPGRHVGGMVSGGLGATDFGNRKTIGGYSREFFNRVREHYTRTYGLNSQQVKDCSDGFYFEPHVAEKIFNDMLQSAGVSVVLDHRLTSVKRDGSIIEAIVVQAIAGSRQIRLGGRMFIDASYEGDLLALAGVRYTLGREGREKYGEKLAGVQKFSPAHQWPIKLSPLSAVGKLSPFIQCDPPGKPGAGDKKIQAYNFRLCMTQRPDRMVPFPRPKNYDPARYDLLARYLARRPELNVGQLMHPVRLPNGTTDTNNNGPFSTDHIGANWDYPEADWNMRRRIYDDHVEYTQGFFYFLAHDARVPARLRDEMNRWGLARDEFTDNGHWPHQLYVREARRMIGEYVMTEKDIMAERRKEDSVGLGSYNTDSHHVQRVVGPDGFILNEGDFQVPVKPYAIPYRSLVPRERECRNLLVPVCMSASHVAYGSIRMEPVYMILGHAAGVAASVAIAENSSVQGIPLGKLREKLLAQKAVLSPEL